MVALLGWLDVGMSHLPHWPPLVLLGVVVPVNRIAAISFRGR